MSEVKIYEVKEVRSKIPSEIQAQL